jgi:N utilization substance protein B
MGVRRAGREAALQMLYQWHLTGEDLPALQATYWEGRSVDLEVSDFANRLVSGVLKHLKTIDGLIEQYSEHWRPDRMEVVDRNLLRLAIQELLHEKETPRAVIINEAIEIARRYGTENSAQFINGMLDSIRKAIEELGDGE